MPASLEFVIKKRWLIRDSLSRCDHLCDKLNRLRRQVAFSNASQLTEFNRSPLQDFLFLSVGTTLVRFLVLFPAQNYTNKSPKVVVVLIHYVEDSCLLIR